MPLSCRFYEQKFPEVDDVVMVKVRSIAEMGAYVTLSEYDNIEGMILLSELSRRRIRSIQKLIRVDRSECVVVLRVDKEKGYIDLSKRRVSGEEARKCEAKFNKGKAVNTILKHVALIEKVDLEMLYNKTAWKLEKKYGGPASSYDALRAAVTEKPQIFDEFDLPLSLKAKVIEQIKRRLTPQPVKIRADVDVTCYEYEGVNAVKAALRAGLALGTEELPIKINLIAPPTYVMTTVSLDKDKGILLLNEAIEAILETITTKQGRMNIKMAPKAVTESEEKELAAKMEEYEKNFEGGSDDEGSGDDDEDVGMGAVAGSGGGKAE